VVNNLGQKVIFYTDALVIGLFVSASAVTFYAIAGNLIEYLRRLILLANSVLNPAISELESKAETGQIQELLIQGCKFSVLVALPICITYGVMGRSFIGLWMGSEYAQPSGDVLFILTLSTLMSLPQNTISNVLYGTSNHHMIAKLRTYEAVANLALSLVLVRFFGIVGVALGTAVPQVVIMGILLPLMVARVIGFSLSRYCREVYLLPCAASLPYLVLSWWVGAYYPAELLISFFLQILALLLCYLAAVYCICFNRQERHYYKSLIKSIIHSRPSNRST